MSESWKKTAHEIVDFMGQSRAIKEVAVCVGIALVGTLLLIHLGWGKFAADMSSRTLEIRAEAKQKREQSPLPSPFCDGEQERGQRAIWYRLARKDVPTP